MTEQLSVVGASCDILNPALGPIDLNLLGLRVELDETGPVTVDITAEPGAGNLLASSPLPKHADRSPPRSRRLM